MEDFYETRIDGVEGEIVGLFGVFDGKTFVLYFTVAITNVCSNMRYIIFGAVCLKVMEELELQST